MNTFKTNKGITLVALIITIIVLLILTVVAISSITDQGLFTKSQEAVNSYEDSRKEEEGKLAGYASEIGKYLNQQTDKTYVGIFGQSEVVATLTSDNEMTITADGTILANKIKPEEISAPEGIENAENYSQFLKFAADGTELICGMSKDGKKITVVGMGEVRLVPEKNLLEGETKTRIYKGNLEGIDLYYILNSDGTIEKSAGTIDNIRGNGYYKIVNNEKIITETSENGPYEYVLAIKQDDGTYKNEGYFSYNGNVLNFAQDTTMNGEVDGMMWIKYILVDEN